MLFIAVGFITVIVSAGCGYLSDHWPRFTIGQSGARRPSCDDGARIDSVRLFFARISPFHYPSVGMPRLSVLVPVRLLSMGSFSLFFLSFPLIHSASLALANPLRDCMPAVSNRIMRLFVYTKRKETSCLHDEEQDQPAPPFHYFLR